MVGLHVGHMGQPCKNGRNNQNGIWGTLERKESCIREKIHMGATWLAVTLSQLVV